VLTRSSPIPGAGKTTLTKSILKAFPSFNRISIDAIIGRRHGIYNADYPPSEHQAHQDEACKIYEAECRSLLQEKKDIVLERSFYAKEDREEYKRLVEEAGGRWILVYLKADRDLLWKRICERRADGINADCALDISPELLDQYVEGFEAPVNEGEIVIETGR